MRRISIRGWEHAPAVGIEIDCQAILKMRKGFCFMRFIMRMLHGGLFHSSCFLCVCLFLCRWDGDSFTGSVEEAMTASAEGGGDRNIESFLLHAPLICFCVCICMPHHYIHFLLNVCLQQRTDAPFHAHALAPQCSRTCTRIWMVKSRKHCDPSSLPHPLTRTPTH